MIGSRLYLVLVFVCFCTQVQALTTYHTVNASDPAYTTCNNGVDTDELVYNPFVTDITGDSNVCLSTSNHQATNILVLNSFDKPSVIDCTINQIDHPPLCADHLGQYIVELYLACYASPGWPCSSIQIDSTMMLANETNRTLSFYIEDQSILSLRISIFFTNQPSSTLSYILNLDATSSVVSSQVVGDPTFTGFHGQQYQIHGLDNNVYNIISDGSFNMNAKFKYLDHGLCLPYHIHCFTHPGTYLFSIGIMTFFGNTIYIESGPYQFGFQTITYNNENMTTIQSIYPDTGYKQDIYLEIISNTRIKIKHVLYTIEIENSDSFLNIISLAASSYSQLQLHQPKGLLGESWQQSMKLLPIDDYSESSNSLFGTSFGYSTKFHLI